MVNNIITYGNTDYFIDKITSVERICCRCDVEKWKRRRGYDFPMYWSKRFHLGGDILDIRSDFEIPFSLPARKWQFFGGDLNPAWKFWDKELPTFEDYKKAVNNPEASWLDFCQFVAEKTNSVKEYEKCKEHAQFVLDRLNELKKERD